MVMSPSLIRDGSFSLLFFLIYFYSPVLFWFSLNKQTALYSALYVLFFYIFIFFCQLKV